MDRRHFGIENSIMTRFSGVFYMEKTGKRNKGRRRKGKQKSTATQARQGLTGF